jgi:flagellar basal-body rod modification protein FlgD
MSSGILSTASTARQAESLIQTSTNGGNTDRSRQTIAQNFDAFLGLLTTQLRNQSPLDPLDANQFTQQLVQFSSVEQQLKTNDILTKVAERLAAGDSAGTKLTAASAAALIGKTVSADASRARLAQGSNGASASWPLTTTRSFERAEITVYDDAGAPVFTTTRSIAPGQTFTWDGRSTNGQSLPAGRTYQIAIRGQDGANADGTPRWVSVPTAISGEVSAVDLTGSDPLVTVGGRTLLYSAITRVGA